MNRSPADRSTAAAALHAIRRAGASRGRWPATFGYVLAGLALATAAPAQAADGPELLESSSRTPYVHRITLYDADGAAINPRDQNPPPFSTARTCGKCHAYGTIGHGFHFNAPDPDAPHGRPGEAWLWTDAATGTVLPLSYRAWEAPGVHHPDAVGLTEWEMTARFGRHLPGGGFGEPPPAKRDAAPESLRWAISGSLEIDCQLCHSVERRYDLEERARQIEQQNLRWAPTAALGLGRVRGAAAKLPDDYDPMLGPNPDYPDQQPPQIQYDLQRFDADDRVFFDLTRTPPAENCYRCHSVMPMGASAGPRWTHAGDVHLAAGMSCTDCHRNGIDHAIRRGFPGEQSASSQPAFAALSCAGCHLGSESAASLAAEPIAGQGSRLEDALPGRLGAPVPAHAGLPPIHFEKLSCTACHSGPWPDEFTQPVQTSLAHGLGLAQRGRSAGDPPLVVQPVFAPGHDGKLHPHRIVWPAWWGVRRGESVTPLSPTRVAEALRTARGSPAERPDPEEAPPTRPEGGAAPEPELDPTILHDPDQFPPLVTRLRRHLGAQLDGDLVYVAAGQLREFDPQGVPGPPAPHTAAAPYLWPLAHDVRPAAQSLGVRGCTDCHADDAALLTGSALPSPRPAPGIRQADFHQLDPQLHTAWNGLFALRSEFKLFATLALLLIAAVILHFGLRGLAWLAGQGSRS